MRLNQFVPCAVATAALMVAIVLPGLEARADSIALGRTDTSPHNPPQGSQSFGGSLGEDFTVGSSAIRVTELGVFDSGGATIPTNQPISVEIFDNSGANPIVVGPVSISSSSLGLSSLTDGYIYVPISPVDLKANHSYRLVAFGFNATNQNGNVNSGDAAPIGDIDASGLISFPGTDSGTINSFSGASTNSYYGLVPGSYPTTADAYQSGYGPNNYSAGSFEFVAVPEPGSLAALTGMGVLGLIAFIRCRSR